MSLIPSSVVVIVLQPQIATLWKICIGFDQEILVHLMEVQRLIKVGTAAEVPPSQNCSFGSISMDDCQ